MTRGVLVAVLCSLAHPSPSPAQTAPSALVDVSMTPAAGAAVADMTGALLGRAEDIVLPPRLFEEKTVLRRSAGVAYRFAKLFALDLPQEEWLRVANHEVFGHGARLRERFDGPIRYQVDVPPPYGSGGGSTSFGFDREPTVEELLAITIGGMEANNVGAARVAVRAVRDSRFAYRDMLRFLLARLDTTAYILGTGDVPEEDGHDVSDFLVLMRESAGSTLTAADLRRRAIVGLADPMLAYAVYGLAVSYLWRGNAAGPVPTIRIGRVRYLPALRFQLAPFGTEWVLDTTLARDGRASRVSVRVGEGPGARSFGGAVHHDALWKVRQLQIDGDAHVWRQPRIRDAGGILRETGAAVLATASLPLDVKWLRWAAVVAQGGYKSRGFIEGEPLGSGFILRGGLGLTR
jgi:hypothetical protein